MNKNELNISIPKPCKQDWNAMTADKSGKFCASCQKTVVDFSRMSDAEIIHYLQDFNGISCGRFSAHQLNRPLVEPLIAKPKNRWAWALSALLLPTVAASQPPIPMEPTEILDPSVPEQKQPKKSLKIEGEVTELGTNMPLENVKVSVLSWGTTIKTTTNAKGFFSVNLPENGEKHDVSLYFSRENMEKRMLSFSNYAAIDSNHLFISMEKSKEEKGITKIRGIVVNEQNEGLPFIVAIIKGTKIGVETDVDGFFELKLPHEMMKNKQLDIEFISVGFERQQLKIDMSEYKGNELKLVMKEAVVGYIVVHQPNFFKRVKYRIQRFFGKLKHD
jgi:CarboxypepD_reg-like domain